MNELVDLLKSPLTDKEIEKMLPEENSPEPDVYTALLNNFTQRNTEALVKCTRLSLDIIKRRVQTNRFSTGNREYYRPPLFKVLTEYRITARSYQIIKICVQISGMILTMNFAG